MNISVIQKDTKIDNIIKRYAYHQKPTYEKWHLNEETWGAHVNNFCHLKR